MCLDTVTTPRKLKSEGTGYKIFRKTNRGNLYFAYCMGKKGIIPTGKWLNEKNYRARCFKHLETITLRSLKVYPMGFHLHLNKRKAEQHFYSSDHVVVPIKFRKACAKGKQDGDNVIVAKEIFIQESGK